MKKNSLQNIEKLISAGKFEDALQKVRELYQTEPTKELGRLQLELLMRREKFQEALELGADLILKDPSDVGLLNNFGAALLRNHRFLEAEAVFLEMLNIDTKSYDAYINLCTVYQERKEYGKQAECAMNAIAINPGSAIAYNNLGSALGELQQNEPSREAYSIALAIDAQYFPALINLAQLEYKLGNFSKSVELYRRVEKIRTLSEGEKELTKYFMSYPLLANGEIKQGFDYYEYGFSKLLPPGTHRARRNFNQPKWDLKSKGKLFIWREQGLGDELMFSTCLPDLLNQGLEITYECEPRLKNIMQRTYPEVRCVEDAKDQPFDFHFPLGSIPRFKRTHKDVYPIQHRVLNCLQHHVSDFADQLRKQNPHGKKVVGLCWRSGLLNIERNKHYSSLLDWGSLLKRDDLLFVNLQYGDCEEELFEAEKLFQIQFLKFPELDLKNDIERVCALIKNIDHVVSIGSAVSILAGYCGVNTKLMTIRNWPHLGQEGFPWSPYIDPYYVAAGEHVASRISEIAQDI